MSVLFNTAFTVLQRYIATVTPSYASTCPWCLRDIDAL